MYIPVWEVTPEMLDALTDAQRGYVLGFQDGVRAEMRIQEIGLDHKQIWLSIDETVEVKE